MQTKARSAPHQQHAFGVILDQIRQRKPGLSQKHLAELAGYDPATVARMNQGKKDLNGPSGRERVVRLMEVLADQGALIRLDEVNALLHAAALQPLFDRHPVEVRLIARLSVLPSGQRQRRTNLPAELTSFVGRIAEIGEVRRLLSTTRLLTLTGSGGCGKTRLAQRVSADALLNYSEGVWVVELAAVTDGASIPDLVAHALGLVSTEHWSSESLHDYLCERQSLLILDNCEHLIDAVATFVITVLRACANSLACSGLFGQMQTACLTRIIGSRPRLLR